MRFSFEVTDEDPLGHFDAAHCDTVLYACKLEHRGLTITALLGARPQYGEPWMEDMVRSLRNDVELGEMSFKDFDAHTGHRINISSVDAVYNGAVQRAKEIRTWCADVGATPWET